MDKIDERIGESWNPFKQQISSFIEVKRFNQNYVVKGIFHDGPSCSSALREDRSNIFGHSNQEKASFDPKDCFYFSDKFLGMLKGTNTVNLCLSPRSLHD
jgi:hypothetical protein